MSLISRSSAVKLSEAVAPVLESLENRLCLSASLVDGTLYVYGPRHDANIGIALDNKNSKILDVKVNGHTAQFVDADVKHIIVTALRGNSQVVIASDVTTPATVLGGGGHDTLIGSANDTLVKGSAGDVFDLWHQGSSSGKVKPAEATITLTGTPTVGYSAAQIRKAYGMPDLGNIATTKNFGAGQTIAIITAFDYPTALADLNTFSTQMGLPQMDSTTFSTVFATGSNPGQTDGDWATEAAMDLEWAHAMAPKAKLILVEANSDISDEVQQAMTAAANAVKGTGGVISMSFWADEVPIDTIINQLYPSVPNISWIGATGDQGGFVGDPQQSPFVTGVGGTTLNLDFAGNRLSETAYANTGGGPSTSVPIPSFQQGFMVGGTASIGAFRGTPDVAMVANPATGIACYTSTGIEDPTTGNANSGLFGWFNAGGSSAGAPMFAGIVADANSLARASLKLPVLGDNLNNQLYQLGKIDYANAFNDITAGNNTLFNAGPGYDFATGLGSPKGNGLINGLAGVLKAPPESMRANYVVSLADPLAGKQAVFNFAGGGSVAVDVTGTRVAITLGATGIANSSLNLVFGKVTIDSHGSIRGHATASVLAPNGDQVTFTCRVDGHVFRKHHHYYAEGEFFAVDPNTAKPLMQGKNPTFYGRFTA